MPGTPAGGNAEKLKKQSHSGQRWRLFFSLPFIRITAMQQKAKDSQKKN
jgi:hypothetical protein